MDSYWWEQAMVIISVPVYAVTILAEIIASAYLKRELYTTKDTLNNFLMTTLNILLDTVMRGAFLFMMAWSFPNRIFNWSEHGILYWIVAIVLTDLVYWFVHWMSHMVRFFWAVHTVHHSSEKYNITVGFRSSVFEPLYRFMFFVPLGFLGFEAADIVLAFAIQQLYGSIIHTELVRRIPVWDWLFVSPSHHAVHHASNPRYLDKNMGMILIVWDKLFGTFEPEDEKYDKIKYGLTTNLNTYHPGTILFKEWKQMWQDVKTAPGLRNKFMYVFGPPGWSHDGSRKTSHQLRLEEQGQ
ncbi:MAG: sterol desaturase family protein [Sphingomonadales bacterium]|jgi:sterol desaturase/sphingolipid hydroxylase (fatty acid hydroxylase superfamily)